MPMESLNSQVDTFRHSDNTPPNRSPKFKIIISPKTTIEINTIPHLSFNAFPTAWEAEFVMIHRWTLYEMGIF